VTVSVFASPSAARAVLLSPVTVAVFASPKTAAAVLL
jgi:hypothetical protein